MFSVAATMLVLAAASAIDIIGVQKQKSQLQTMTDAAVLAAASEKTDNVGEIKKFAEAAAESNNQAGLDNQLQVRVVGDINLETEIHPLVIWF